jgi:hypothetical protein
MLFQLGQVVATANAMEVLEQQEMAELIRKHVTGDFGVLDKHDIDMNKRAIKNNDDRVFSAYMVRGNKVYVITEWDRSVTTVLLAEDY